MICLENNVYPKATILGEPWLSKYNLRSSLGGYKKPEEQYLQILNLFICSDGTTDLMNISELLQTQMWNILEDVHLLQSKGLLKVFRNPS